MFGPGSRRGQARTVVGMAVVAAWCAASWLAFARDAASGLGAGAGVSARGSALAASLLADYFQKFLVDQDVEEFREQVSTRFSEPALDRIAADALAPRARRAAVAALGFIGTFDRSNACLGRALRDPDEAVRQLAESALWSVWFRADTPENNQALAEIARTIARGRLDQAEDLATHLIAVAPRFAEAYNQRAIIYFQQGRFAESAGDCRSVLARNPYHIGAASGLAQCELALDHPAEALEALRLASRLQPYSEGLRAHIQQIEQLVQERPAAGGSR